VAPHGGMQNSNSEFGKVHQLVDAGYGMDALPEKAARLFNGLQGVAILCARCGPQKPS